MTADSLMGRHFMLYNIFSSSSAICSCAFQKLLLTLRIKNSQNLSKKQKHKRIRHISNDF